MTDANLADANPYSAPDAALDTGVQDELYEPSIFSFNGRIGRLRYLAYSFAVNFVLMLVMIPLMGATAFVGGAAGPESMGVLGMVAMALFYIVTIVISVMFSKRRLNDLNRSGWWFLLFIIPIVNLLLAIYLIFFPGTDGSNDFGPAPTANSLGVQILGWMLPALMLLGILSAIAIPMFAGV
ncbi:MAG: DUF805 domain-containing protein [Gammaproteobacteria bacterium]|nr:DUF805 domain-containing protein [Gammaproteobacteria bacterium]